MMDVPVWYETQSLKLYLVCKRLTTHQQQHLAAAEGHMEAVELLLKFGADISITDRWGR